MASLVGQAKKDTDKDADSSKAADILKKFQTDVKDVPEVTEALTKEQKKDLKVAQINKNLNARSWIPSPESLNAL